MRPRVGGMNVMLSCVQRAHLPQARGAARKDSRGTARAAQKSKRCSHTGTRTRVCWVRASYPNRLDYMGRLTLHTTNDFTNDPPTHKQTLPAAHHAPHRARRHIAIPTHNVLSISSIHLMERRPPSTPRTPTSNANRLPIGGTQHLTEGVLRCAA